MSDAPGQATGAGEVLTVTVNPAVDVSMTVDRFVPDHKNRAHTCRREAGGGGVNVARALKRLGVDATSLVVAGGATGTELVSLIRAEGINVVPFAIAEPTRESIAITDASTERQYRVSIDGPTIDDAVELHGQIVERARGHRLVVLSGGIAPGLPTDFYATVIADLDPDTITIVDTHGPALAAVIGRERTIIKPSQRELAELVGWKPTTTDEIVRAAREVLDRGALSAVVASRGPSGALLVARSHEPRWFRPPPVQPVSTVGAGDSMVAGIAASLVHGSSLDEAVRYGVAAGTAAVLTPGTELCNRADVDRFASEVIVTSSGDSQQRG